MGEPEESNLYDDNLRKKTRWSIVWTVIRLLSNQFFSFIVFVVLARMLSPADIGVFAIVTLFAELGRILASAGLVNYIFRVRSLTPELLDTIFWSNMALSILISIFFVVLAEPVLILAEQPRAVAPLMAVICILPVAAAGASHIALCSRNFGHKAIAIRSFFSGMIGGAAAVGAAYAGWGIWSLVVQRVVTEVVSTLVAWQAYKWMPGRNFAFKMLREITGFGFNLALAQVISLFFVRMQDLIIGATIGAAAVGIYRSAWRMTELIANGAIQPFSTVSVQTFGRLQDNHEHLVKAYREMIFFSSVIAYPALIGFGAIAPHAIPVLYGEVWTSAGPVAQILSFLAAPFTINYVSSSILNIKGRGSDLRAMAMIQLVLTIGLTYMAAPYGLEVIAITYVCRAYATVPIQLWFVKRRSGIGFKHSLEATMAPLLAASLMGVGVYGFMNWVEPHLDNAIFLIAASVALGAVLYPALLLATSGQARSLARTGLRRLKKN